ncbi:MAG: transaldolase [Micrococcaceae bacterium]
MTTSPTELLLQNGTAPWLDDLSRERIDSGNLEELITTRNVVGVTTNPTIFANALSDGEAYSDQLKELAAQGADVDDAVFEMTTQDVSNACDIFAPVAKATKMQDGRVSIEVDPRLARETQKTVDSAEKLWKKIGKDNLLVKIPATVEGLDAITEVIGQGISVNVTLIFSLDRYQKVIDAYFAGLEKAQEKGIDLSTIHSVASFFVSRVDTEVDSQLDALGTDEATALKNKAGLANARLAYQVFEKSLETKQWKKLAAEGANVQRPLWASTGVKDPSLPDTLYVEGLVAENTVNTMPEATLQATYDHGKITGDTITGTYDESQEVIDQLEKLGISYDKVVAKLEDEGIDKFEASWKELLDTVQTGLKESK